MSEPALVKSFDKWGGWGGFVTIETVKVYYHGRRVELLSRHKLELIETLIVNMTNSSTYCQAGPGLITRKSIQKTTEWGIKIIFKFHVVRQPLVSRTHSNYISNFTELLIDYLLKTGLSWLNISLYQWPGGTQGRRSEWSLEHLDWIVVFNYKWLLWINQYRPIRIVGVEH